MKTEVTHYSLDLGAGDVRAGVVGEVEGADFPVVLPVQTHSCNVAVIEASGSIPTFDDTDAVICLRRGMVIGVRTADCVPVVMYAPDNSATAAVHAGWKGSIGGIVTATLERLALLGADLSQLKVAFGPSICGRCYEVSEELAMRFTEAGFGEAVSHRHVDLQKVNLLRLIRMGVRAENIAMSDVCTYETATLPSWRRQSSSRRLLTWIEII